MKILVTGAKGFVGKNLCESLKNIRDGKDRRECYQELLPLTIYEYDLQSTPEELNEWSAQTDFVFNLAGVNRPDDPEDFMKGNFGFASTLLSNLEEHGNKCPVMLSSSAQASLVGRYAGSQYGESKLAGEDLFRKYSERTGAPVLIYRFPNLYGKWCRPNYNSAVATFCNNIANNLPIQVNDPLTLLELLYVDDLVEEMLQVLIGGEHRCDYDEVNALPQDDGPFCYVPTTDVVTLGEIFELLEGYKSARESLDVPNVAEGSFSKKLYTTYLSYLDPSDFSYKLKMNEDARGSFTEILHTADRGQVSINISKPSVTKGNHWHHSKWEKFCVVSGEGIIRMRRVGMDNEGNPYPIVEYKVSGDEPVVVEMIPGYTHSITNLSDAKDLITVMWANEIFDSAHPDTYSEEV